MGGNGLSATSRATSACTAGILVIVARAPFSCLRRQANTHAGYVKEPGDDQDVTAENFDNLHERVLAFVGSFTAAQFAMDHTIHMYLKKRLPNVGPVLSNEYLERVRDDQRLKLFKAVAKEADDPADLTNFDYIFNRAKQVRDKVADAAAIHDGPRQRGMVRRVVLLNHKSDGGNAPNRPLVPDPPFPSTFDKLLADCGWISRHASYLGYVTDSFRVLDLTENEIDSTSLRHCRQKVSRFRGSSQSRV